MAKPPQALEGRSLLPLLRKPGAAWPHPAITTFQRNDHTGRTEDWRYIRYANGDEELYDHTADPHEWHNLATQPGHDEVLARLRRQLPRVNAGDAPVWSPGR